MTNHAQANTLDLKGDPQMPKGYWIVRVDVKDEEPVKRYVAGNHAIFEKFGGAIWSAHKSLRFLKAPPVLYMS